MGLKPAPGGNERSAGSTMSLVKRAAEQLGNMLGKKPEGTMGVVEHVKTVYGVNTLWEALMRGGLRCGMCACKPMLCTATDCVRRRSVHQSIYYRRGQ